MKPNKKENKKDQKKTEERRLVGICVYCSEPIYNNERWEVLYYSRPGPLEKDYKKGILHNRCRLPALKRLVIDLIIDVNSLTWLIEGINREGKEEEEEKKMPKKPRGEIM